MSFFLRYLATFCVLLVVAVVARMLLEFPVWLTFAALAIAWPVLGTLITLDDDLPGGWSNPDGKTVPEWMRLWWWADILLVRGGVVTAVFAVERALVDTFAVLPFIAGVTMIAIGLPVFLKGVRRDLA